MPAIGRSRPTSFWQWTSAATATATTFDQGTKLFEYRQVASVETIVSVDPINRLTRTYQRMAGGNGWQDSTFAQPHDVALPALGTTLTEVEIFSRD